MVVEQESTGQSIGNQAIAHTESDPGSDALSGGGVRRDMLRYLLTVLGVITGLWAAPFVLVRSGGYDRINPSFYARPLNYPLADPVRDADVLLFGDSTALLGIDPSQMSSSLGVEVVNLVNTQPSLVVNDDLTLRRYLGSNKAPKVIVFYFAPWDFDYGHTDFHARPTYEGQELLLRRGTGAELLAFARKHPEDAGIFPLRFYATALELVLHHVRRSNQDVQLKATHGHVDNMDETALPASCAFTPLLLNNIRFAWVRSLGAKYATPQTKVLFYVAPVPSCSNVASVMGRPYNELPAAPPVQVLPGFFSNDIRYLHPLPFAVPQITSNLIDVVRPLLKDGEQPAPSSSPISQ